MTTTTNQAGAVSACPVCGEPVAQAGRGRPSRYDRADCRREAAYRRHRAAIDPGALRDRADQHAGELPALAAAVTDARDAGDLAAVATRADELARVAELVASSARAVPEVEAARAWVTEHEPAAVTWPTNTPAPAPSASVPTPASAPEPAPANVTPAAPAPVPAARRTAAGELVPTAEQAEIIDACAAGEALVIEAGAGTGKTSTLRLAAAAMDHRRGVYVAYNKAIATEASRKFPGHVSCSTAHSLAFRAVGRQYAHRLRGPRIPAAETARRLGVTDGLALGADQYVTAVQLARLAMKTLDRYCYSADDEIGPQHVPHVNGVTTQPARDALVAALVPLAVRAWADIREPRGELRFTHDHYLKMWALTRPELAADFVLYDEAQDANPVVAAVVQNQRNAQLIAVGDSCQAIYGWRGAVDALADWPADRRLRLSQSFRFGAPIAAEANKWLAELAAPLRLVGSPDLHSTVTRGLARPAAVLCRTNAEAITQAMDAMDDGRRVALVGGGAAIKSLAEAAEQLQRGRRTSHPELFMFKNWGEVQEYAAYDDAGELGTLVRLVDEHGADVIVDAANRLTGDERHAELTVSTAHKAKGREWDSVAIAGDFRPPGKDKDTGRRKPIPREDAMLAYVAVTRARHQLDRTGLAWIDNPDHDPDDE